MKLLRVRQKLVSNPIADVPAAVHAALDRLELEVPQGDVGITAGSRGIANIAAITRAAGDWLREHGARPFLFPAMGSHNGGTAEGQRAMIESLGLTEQAMGMPIRASMDVVKLGTVSTGDVWMDRNAFESAGVLVLNRIKLHTCFAGPVQSGLTKMMVVGMGKIPSAETFHSAPTPQMKDMLLEMGQVVLDSGKIWAGLAILEDGFDQTAELHALRPDEILSREPQLLERHRALFSAVAARRHQRAGGRRDRQDVQRHRHGHERHRLPRRPRRRGPHEAVHPRDRGPVAVAVVARQRDRRGPGRFHHPPAARRDRRAKDVSQQLHDRPHGPRENPDHASPTTRSWSKRSPAATATKRWIFIPNTLHLETLYASEDLRDELAANPLCTVDAEPVELTFSDGRHQLSFDWRSERLTREESTQARNAPMNSRRWAAMRRHSRWSHEQLA